MPAGLTTVVALVIGDAMPRCAHCQGTLIQERETGQSTRIFCLQCGRDANREVRANEQTRRKWQVSEAGLALRRASLAKRRYARAAQRAAASAESEPA